MVMTTDGFELVAGQKHQSATDCFCHGFLWSPIHPDNEHCSSSGSKSPKPKKHLSKDSIELDKSNEGALGRKQCYQIERSCTWTTRQKKKARQRRYSQVNTLIRLVLDPIREFRTFNPRGYFFRFLWGERTFIVRIARYSFEMHEKFMTNLMRLNIVQRLLVFHESQKDIKFSILHSVNQIGIWWLGKIALHWAWLLFWIPFPRRISSPNLLTYYLPYPVTINARHHSRPGFIGRRNPERMDGRS